MTNEEIIKDIIRIEGGYVDHPNDPGGATKYGISLRFYKKEINELADKETIFTLTEDQAYRIYKKHFYFKAGCDFIPSIKLRHIVFDQCVNVGIKRALKRLHTVLNQLTEMKEEFCPLGPETEDKISRIINYFWEIKSHYALDPKWEINSHYTLNPQFKMEEVLINNYILESIKYYYSLGKRENYRVFFLGWMNRILRFVERS